MKNKGVAILLCFFLGIFGAHKFYLGEVGVGITYLILAVLFITAFIPALLAFIDFIVLLITPDTEFDRKYNRMGGAIRTTTSAQDATRALADLKKLYEDGVITAEEYEQKRQNLLRQL